LEKLLRTEIASNKKYPVEKKVGQAFHAPGKVRVCTDNQRRGMSSEREKRAKKGKGIQWQIRRGEKLNERGIPSAVGKES